MSPEQGHRWFAAMYDRLTARVERAVIGPARRELLSRVTGDILEIGAGTGANFSYYPEDARVIALEPDPYMLERAQARLQSLKLHNIELRQTPAEHLPFPDASVDAVVSTLVLCTVADPAAAIREMRRVLRPAGSLLFIEHVRGDGLLGRFRDVIRPVWSWGGGGCQINRTTEDSLRSAFAVDVTARTMASPLTPLITGTATAR
jgi:ubiquinone/menaquinone biosynthesis C-methylase UbiE